VVLGVNCGGKAKSTDIIEYLCNLTVI
jgi:hypothetical protein